MMINSELLKQAEYVKNRTHELLGDQLLNRPESEQITISVPKAFTYLAMYLEMLCDDPGVPVSAWGHHEGAFNRKYKNQRGAMRTFFERMIYLNMHDELHLLSTHTHSFLEVPSCLKEQEPTDTNNVHYLFDDSIPF